MIPRRWHVLALPVGLRAKLMESTALRYASAFLAIALAVLVHASPLGTFLHPTGLFTATIVAVAWYGGAGPGLLAAIIAAVVLPQRVVQLYPLLGGFFDMPRFLAFALIALAVGWAVTSRRRAEAALRQSEADLLKARDELEGEVAARTAELRLSDEQWRAAFECNPTMYFMVDASGTIVSVNSFGAERLGYGVSELTGQPVLNLFVESDRERVQRNAAACFERIGETMRWEACKIRKDGTMLWVRETASAVVLKSNPVLLVVCEDISDRKRAEALLAGEKRILEMVAKGASLAEILETLCHLVEEQAQDVLASVLLVQSGRLLHGGAPSLPKAYTEAIDGAVIGPSVGSSGTAAHRGEQVIVSDIATDPLWVDYREGALSHGLRACWSTPIFSPEGSVIGTFAMYYREPRSPSAADQEMIDQITDLAGVAIQRKLAEERLRRSEAYLSETQSISHTGSWAWSPAGGIGYWSEECYRMLGFDAADGLPSFESFLERVVPADRAQMIECLDHALCEKADFESEYRVVHPNGAVRNIQAWAHRVIGASGELLEYVGSVMDVTEHRRAEAAARRSEQELRGVIDTIPAMVWSAAPDGAVDFLSSRWREFSGLSPEQSLGWDWQAAIHPDEVEPSVARWRAAVDTGQPFEGEMRLRGAEGEYRWFYESAVPLRDEQGRVLKWYGVVTDIEDRKRAEEAARRSENELRDAIETIPAMVWITGPDGAAEFFNRRWQEYTGMTLDESLGWEWESPVHPEDFEQYMARWRECIATGRPIEEEVRFRRADGEYRWFLDVGVPLRDEQGNVLKWYGIVTDIDDRKRAEAERAKLEERLRQAEKMEAIGRFASGIAHDFNNMLGGILAYGEMLLDEAPDNTARKRYAQNVLTAATRGRELVDQILTYSRSQRGRRTPTDICSTVAETLEFVRSSLPARITLYPTIPHVPLVVLGDATQLHQVVMNLCSNSIQAMKAGGPLRVAITPAEIRAERALSHGNLKAGAHARLSVQDGGCGMDEATLVRIFEPFFTTKEAGRGTGLGLALVYAIVADLGGAIDVRTVLDEGSTFSIYLPLPDVPAAAAPST